MNDPKLEFSVSHFWIQVYTFLCVVRNKCNEAISNWKHQVKYKWKTKVWPKPIPGRIQLGRIVYVNKVEKCSVNGNYVINRLSRNDDWFYRIIVILSCNLHDNLPNLVRHLQDFYRLLLVLHRILVYDVVAQLPSSSSILPDGKWLVRNVGVSWVSIP